MKMEVAKNIAILVSNAILMLIILSMRIFVSIYTLVANGTYKWVRYAIVLMPIGFNIIFLALITDYVTPLDLSSS